MEIVIDTSALISVIAGTHGRSAWILDDITPLRQMTPEVWEKEFFLFQNRRATKWEAISRGATRGHQLFIGRNPLSMSQVPPSNSPTRLVNSAAIHFWLKEKPAQPLSLRICKPDGQVIKVARVEADAGLNRYWWNLRADPSATAVKIFRRRMDSLFKDLQGKVRGELKKDLKKLQQQWAKAVTPAEMNQVWAALTEKFRTLISRRLFPRPLRGTEVGAGEYIIEMKYKGQVFRSTLLVREDPLKGEK